MFPFLYLLHYLNQSHKLHFAKSRITSSSPLDIIFLMSGPHPFHLLMVLTTMLFLLTIRQSISSFTCYVINQMFIPPLSPSSNLLKTISPSLELLHSSPSPHPSSRRDASSLSIPSTSPELLRPLISPHPTSYQAASPLPISLTSPELLRSSPSPPPDLLPS